MKKNSFIFFTILILSVLSFSCSEDKERINNWDDVFNFVNKNYGVSEGENKNSFLIFDSINGNVVMNGVFYIPDGDDFWIQISHNYGNISSDDAYELLCASSYTTCGSMVVIENEKPAYVYRTMVKGNGLAYDDLKDYIDRHIDFVTESLNHITEVFE